MSATQELQELARMPLAWFALPAAFLDGVVIAQALDWISAGHRLSIWVLL